MLVADSRRSHVTFVVHSRQRGKGDPHDEHDAAFASRRLASVVIAGIGGAASSSRPLPQRSFGRLQNICTAKAFYSSSGEDCDTSHPRCKGGGRASDVRCV